MFRLACATGGLAVLGWFASAAAESVPIGRYHEVSLAGAAAHPYRMSGVDPQRSGRSRARVGLRPERVWSKRLPHRRLTPPAVLADGLLAVGSAGGVYGLQADGEVRWFADVGAVRFTPTVTRSGELLVASGRDELHLIDAQGRPRRLAENLPLVGSPLLLESGAAAIGGRDGYVHILDLDGTRVASVPTTLRAVHWAALVGDGLIVAAGRGQALTLLSVHAGLEREIEVLQRVASSPAVASDGTLWVLGEHGTVWGISPGGRVRASNDLGAPAESLALGGDGGVRIALSRGELVCIGANGVERWRRGVDGRPGPLLLDVEDTALFVTTRGTLYGVAHDGELLFRRPLGVRGAGRPVLGHDGTLYVVSYSGQIEAWR